MAKKDEEEQDEEMTTEELVRKAITYTVIGIVFLTVLFGSFYIISAGERGVIVTLGNPSNAIITEGLHLKFPLVQKIVKFDIKTMKDEVEATSASRDLQTVNAKIAVNYHLEESSAPRIYQEVGVGYVDRILSPAIQESTKASTAQFTAEELITKREQVREKIRELLREKMAPRGIVVEDVLITNFDFSKSFNDAIEAKVTAEQNALKELNNLKAVEYQAKQRIAQAQGEAEAIKIQAQAIQSQGGKEYVNLQWIAKWDGKLSIISSDAVMPIVNMNTLSNAPYGAGSATIVTNITK